MRSAARKQCDCIVRLSAKMPRYSSASIRDSVFFVAEPNPSLIERKERWARKMSGKAKPAVRSENRLPPGQHLTPGFPVLDLGIKPEISLGEWRLEVGGLGREPANIHLGTIQRPPAIRRRERLPLRHHLEQVRLPLARRRLLHPRRTR